MPKLNNWSVVINNSPEFDSLHGNVSGHPKIPDGSLVTTSPIARSSDDGCIITKNTTYELGEIDSEYEKLYPDARERLFESLKDERKLK